MPYKFTHTVRKEKIQMKTMKKVLALVLALTMVFAFGSLAVSAKEITSGQIYCGPEGTVYANPGEIVKAPIQFVADAFESDGYPTDGTLHIPFMVFTGDAELAPLTGIELTEEAKAAGVALSEDTAVDENNQSIIGEVTLPSSYLYGNKSIILFTVEISVSENWQVVDHVAQQEISAEFFAGGDAGQAYIETAGDEVVNVDGIINENIVIEARPYEPTVWEKIEAKIKGYIVAFIDILIIGLEQLKKLLG